MGPIVFYQSSGSIQKSLTNYRSALYFLDWGCKIDTGLIVIIQWYLPQERVDFSQSSEGTEIIGRNKTVKYLLEEHKTSSYTISNNYALFRMESFDSSTFSGIPLCGEIKR